VEKDKKEEVDGSMFEVRSRMKQEYPLDVVQDGNHKRVFLPSRETIETEEITPVIERLEKKRKVLVKEVKKTKKTSSKKSTKKTKDKKDE
jgi:hypothetical protein